MKNKSDVKKPVVPYNTCPYIDSVIHIAVELTDIIESQEPENTDMRTYAMSLLEALKSNIEHVRESNNLLRKSGKYWYEQCKKQK